MTVMGALRMTVMGALRMTVMGAFRMTGVAQNVRAFRMTGCSELEKEANIIKKAVAAKQLP